MISWKIYLYLNLITKDIRMTIQFNYLIIFIKNIQFPYLINLSTICVNISKNKYTYNNGTTNIDKHEHKQGTSENFIEYEIQISIITTFIKTKG